MWNNYRAFRQRVGIWLLLLGLISGLSMGCPATIQYEARQGLVEILGATQTQQRLQETLLRSINPRIIEVNVTNDYLHYRYQQPLIGAYGIQTGVALTGNRVYFRNISRVEVFDNHGVFVRSVADQVVAQVIFTNDQDAKAFADLMLSFHAYRTKDGS